MDMSQKSAPFDKTLSHCNYANDIAGMLHGTQHDMHTACCVTLHSSLVIVGICMCVSILYDNHRRGDNPPRKDNSNTASVNEVSKEDWQKRITSGGVLGLDHFVQQYPQESGCYACYKKFEGNHARKKEWCHNHRTCEVCQSFVKAKQQTSKGILPRLARVLDAGWKGVYAVELTNELREKEKEMLKKPAKAAPNKGKGKGKEKGGETAAK